MGYVEMVSHDQLQCVFARCQLYRGFSLTQPEMNVLFVRRDW